MFELAEDSGATEVIFNKLNNVLTEVALTVMVNFANTGNGITPGVQLSLSQRYWELV